MSREKKTPEEIQKDKIRTTGYTPEEWERVYGNTSSNTLGQQTSQQNVPTSSNTLSEVPTSGNQSTSSSTLGQQIGEDEFYAGDIEPSVAVADAKQSDPYEKFRQSLPENLRAEDPRYDMRRYWELNGKPSTFDDTDGMFVKGEDGVYHSGSASYDAPNKRYEFVKSKDHPTIGKEFDWYYGDTDDAKSFRDEGYVPVQGGDGKFYYVNKDSVPVEGATPYQRTNQNQPTTNQEQTSNGSADGSAQSPSTNQPTEGNGGEGDGTAAKTNGAEPQNSSVSNDSNKGGQSSTLTDNSQSGAKNGDQKKDESIVPPEYQDFIKDDSPAARVLANFLGAQSAQQKPSESPLNEEQKSVAQTYDDQIRGYNEMLAQLTAQQQAEQQQTMTSDTRDSNLLFWGGLTEGAAAIANLIGTTRGATSQQWTSPQPTWQNRVDQLRRERETRLQNYRTQLNSLNAAKRQLMQNKASYLSQAQRTNASLAKSQADNYFKVEQAKIKADADIEKARLSRATAIEKMDQKRASDIFSAVKTLTNNQITQRAKDGLPYGADYTIKYAQRIFDDLDKIWDTLSPETKETVFGISSVSDNNPLGI